MDIKNKPTLEEKQAFWAEQLPNFEAKYWLPSHFELLEFDMEGGNYEVRDVLPEHYSEDDADDIYHRVNSGWAMWKKAINFTKAQAVPEAKLSRSITLTCAQLREAFMFGAPDKDDQEQLETEMTITWSEDGHSGKGYYCYYSELPEEGAIFLDEVIEAQEQNHEHS